MKAKPVCTLVTKLKFKFLTVAILLALALPMSAQDIALAPVGEVATPPALETPVAPAAIMPAVTNAAPKKLKTVVITGSSIPTSESTPIVPVIAITADDIAKQGAATLSDVIRRLPQNSGSLDDKFQNGFAPGSSGASLRGLGAKYTLILLNGHRVAPYGYGQNISDAFADLNTLPLDAIDRVEVLTEGASAIYGSDAIGGVINIILKRDFDGTELKARFGNTFKDDMFEQTYSLTTGLHDKKHDTSLLVNLEYYRRNSLNMTERDFSKSADQSGRGGYDWRSDIGPNPAYFFPVSGDTIYGATGSAYDGSVFPSGAMMTPGGSIVQGTDGNYFDFNPYLQLVPETERYGVYMVGQRKINDNVDFYVETSYRRSWTRTFAAPTPIAGDTTPNLYGNPNGYEFIIPATNPYNLLGTDVTFRHRLTEFGPRIDDIWADSFRIVPGINFHLANEWEASMDFSFMPNTTETRGKNYIDADKLQAALNSTDPATAINLFAPGTNYAPGLANNPALIESLKFNPKRNGEAELMMGGGKIGGPLFSLPGGKLRMSVGAEGRAESFSDQSDAITAAERQVSTGGTSGKGERTGAAVYSELSIPIFGEDNALPGIRSLEFQVAARFDYYSDFGNALTPKVALKYSPCEDLVFRASYGQGFRAPSLEELYLGSSVSYDDAIDIETNSPYFNTPRQYRVFHAGDPQLKAETSENYSVGVVYEPKFVPGLTLNATWGRIDLKDAIDSFQIYHILKDLPYLVDRNGTTYVINTISNSWINVAARKVEYVDLGGNYVKPTSWGEFTFAADFSYQYFFEDHNLPSAANPTGISQLAGTADRPEWRGNGSVFWNYRKFAAGVSVNWVGSFDQAYQLTQDTVPDWITYDLQASYEFPKELTLTLGVHNFTDEAPPFYDGESEGYSFTSHDPIGRQWYLQLTKKF